MQGTETFFLYARRRGAVVTLHTAEVHPAPYGGTCFQVPGAHYLMSALASAIGLLTMTRVAVLARRRGPLIALPSATVDDAQHFALLPSDAVGSSPDS